MTIAQALNDSKLDSREAELLLAHVLKHNRAYLRAHNNDRLSPAIFRRFKALTKRRLKHEPIAYIVGFQPFCGRDFSVNRSTLIPRPETEGLVELVSEYLDKRGTWDERRGTIIDIGTGSGCLAVTLAPARPDATVIASDISDKALAVAKKNARQLSADVTFVKDSLLGDKLVKQIITKLPNDRITKGITKFSNDKTSKISGSGLRTELALSGVEGDLVFVSNLPYLPSSYKKDMAPDVTLYEPSTALFAGKDGMSLIEKLLHQISHFCHLERSEFDERSRKIRLVPNKPDLSIPLRSTQDDKIKNVHVFLEIDPSQSAALKKLANELFPTHQISIKQDLCGRDRYLIINRK